MQETICQCHKHWSGILGTVQPSTLQLRGSSEQIKRGLVKLGKRFALKDVVAPNKPWTKDIE